MDDKIISIERQLQTAMISIKKVSLTNVYKVETPYTFDNGDQITIYLKHNEEYGYHLTDEGWTLWEFNNAYAESEYFEKKNETLITTLCEWYNVIYKRSYQTKDNRYIQAQLIKPIPNHPIDKFDNPLANLTTVILRLNQQAQTERWQNTGSHENKNNN